MVVGKDAVAGGGGPIGEQLALGIGESCVGMAELVGGQGHLVVGYFVDDLIEFFRCALR